MCAFVRAFMQFVVRINYECDQIGFHYAYECVGGMWCTYARACVCAQTVHFYCTYNIFNCMQSNLRLLWLKWILLLAAGSFVQHQFECIFCCQTIQFKHRKTGLFMVFHKEHVHLLMKMRSTVLLENILKHIDGVYNTMKDTYLNIF